ncbi:Activator of (R)-2-hydroxyglutaryl-CoA dehydratase [hydrothermal vent metagenome]|uniref:Activator of (R)-2-hydroxyglutaryl-CoA dehydratase n=1 Tax=hydrothermal vent metagenome TaxID=652676 RepID=A0A3B0X9M2_9ZZZZ
MNIPLSQKQTTDISSLKPFDSITVTPQWYEPAKKSFKKHEKDTATILFGGLSNMHDQLMEAAIQSLGYKAKALNCPDREALQTGKEFGNRGQCNPTYFTVGNLVKHLIHLRDKENIKTQDIIDNYVFVTASGCGPCRFGMYNTEYRKALRDAGFENFRTLTFEQDSPENASEKDDGLELNLKFYLRIIRVVMLADVVNLMGYRIRPYEITPGDTDIAMDKCRLILQDTISKKKNLRKALRECKSLFNGVKTNKLQVKAKVAIIGEFWAMTTEGDGNYKLQRFLESEGAECDIQPITNWILYMIWLAKFDSNKASQLEKNALNQTGNSAVNQSFLRFLLKMGDLFMKKTFYRYAKHIGLTHYKLSDMNKIASLAGKHYYNELTGGEGHMEVGKLIYNFSAKKSHLVISVKPFGCMPSSGVSDGIQSLVTKQYPGINFLPIETSGDGAVNVYSRIQMALFKARQFAQKEYEQALNDKNISLDTLEKKVNADKKMRHATTYAPHTVAGSMANIIYQQKTA